MAPLESPRSRGFFYCAAPKAFHLDDFTPSQIFIYFPCRVYAAVLLPLLSVPVKDRYDNFFFDFLILPPGYRVVKTESVVDLIKIG